VSHSIAYPTLVPLLSAEGRVASGRSPTEAHRQIADKDPAKRPSGRELPRTGFSCRVRVEALYELRDSLRARFHPSRRRTFSTILDNARGAA
jgi:hypothetical protein